MTEDEDTYGIEPEVWADAERVIASISDQSGTATVVEPDMVYDYMASRIAEPVAVEPVEVEPDVVHTHIRDANNVGEYLDVKHVAGPWYVVLNAAQLGTFSHASG